MLTMNPEIRAEWAARLRSGEYKQGRSVLKMIDPVTGVTKHCCMGVLCELAVEAGVLTYSDEEGDGVVRYGLNRMTGQLPEEVISWAQIDDITQGDPHLITQGDPHLTTDATCSQANDLREWTFAYIADLIDGGPDASS